MDTSRSVFALLGGIVFALATMYALASAINGHRPSGRTTVLVLAAGIGLGFLFAAIAPGRESSK